MVGRVTKDELPITHLRRYYDALHALFEQEQTALAELHAEDPTLLIHRFRESVKALEKVPLIEAPFYPNGRKELPSPPTPVADIKKTHHFASQLSDGRPRRVEGCGDALDFYYVDRELSPLRTERTNIPRRSLDLVLANAHDRTPIFAELKIRTDKLAYVAFIQVLMVALELIVPAEGQRFRGHPPAHGLAWPQVGPFADLYLIAFEPPATGMYREPSLQATEDIARQLVEHSIVSQYLRRIAYLEAFADGDLSTFTCRFAFGIGV